MADSPRPAPPRTIDAYIAGFPPPVQTLLEQVRATIRQAAPAAQEAIKYGMPTFVLHGNLVYFAAFKRHIGLFSIPSGVAAFAPELAAYRTGKGSVQLPLDRPLPLALIGRLVAYRVAQSEASHRAKEAAGLVKAGGGQ